MNIEISELEKLVGALLWSALRILSPHGFFPPTVTINGLFNSSGILGLTENQWAREGLKKYNDFSTLDSKTRRPMVLAIAHIYDWQLNGII